MMSEDMIQKGAEGGGGQNLGDMSPKKSSFFFIGALPLVNCNLMHCASIAINIATNSQHVGKD